jgi:hypothetical protein
MMISEFLSRIIYSYFCYAPARDVKQIVPTIPLDLHDLKETRVISVQIHVSVPSVGRDRNDNHQSVVLLRRQVAWAVTRNVH